MNDELIEAYEELVQLMEDYIRELHERISQSGHTSVNPKGPVPKPAYTLLERINIKRRNIAEMQSNTSKVPKGKK